MFLESSLVYVYFIFPLRIDVASITFFGWWQNQLWSQNYGLNRILHVKLYCFAEKCQRLTIGKKSLAPNLYRTGQVRTGPSSHVSLCHCADVGMIRGRTTRGNREAGVSYFAKTIQSCKGHRKGCDHSGSVLERKMFVSFCLNTPRV